MGGVVAGTWRAGRAPDAPNAARLVALPCGPAAGGRPLFAGAPVASALAAASAGPAAVAHVPGVGAALWAERWPAVVYPSAARPEDGLALCVFRDGPMEGASPQRFPFDLGAENPFPGHGVC